MPPDGADRVSELGEWVKREVQASGTSWDVNSVYAAVAGLGWSSFGFKGEANLILWTFDGIQITMRESLVLDPGSPLERPAFWLPKAISDDIRNQTKLEAQSRRKDGSESTELLSYIFEKKTQEDNIKLLLSGYCRVIAFATMQKLPLQVQGRTTTHLQ